MGDWCKEVPPPLLVQGVAQFNQGDYFGQHETLETLWRAESRPVRLLYQGILQIGVALYHIQRGNHHGAVYMFTRGLQYLQPFAPRCQGVDVAALIAASERALSAVHALGPGRLHEFDWTLAPRVALAWPPFVSVIVPVLEDADELAALLRDWAPRDDVEQVVVSGTPSDAELAALRRAYPAVRWLTSEPGRGRQMNAGAAAAHGRWLLFLHADTRLPADWLDVIRAADERAEIVGGSFRFVLDSPAPWARLVEWGVRQRVRWIGLPYGDQALFVRRGVFEQLGGYRPWPLMEDVEFVQRLTRCGRLLHSAAPVRVSARRWEQDGWLRRSAENVALLLGYMAGFSPATLARWYYRRLPRVAAALGPPPCPRDPQ